MLSDQLHPKQMVALTEKYQMEGLVGDQDWLTLLGWEYPEFFYMLPCQFNWQTNPEYKVGKLRHLWEKYRKCPPDTKILHRNGRL